MTAEIVSHCTRDSVYRTALLSEECAASGISTPIGRMSALGEQGSSKKAKKHGKQYRSIESDDEQEKWSGGVVPTRNNVRTCCKGTCILQLFQVYSGFLLIFVLLSTLLYPVTVYVNKEFWKTEF